MAINIQLLVLSNKEIVKCQRHVCLITKIYNKLGPWVHSNLCGSRQCRGCMGPWVTNWISLTRWWRHFCRPLSSGWWTTKFEWYKSETRHQLTRCWPACIGTDNRNMPLLTALPVGENELTYIDGLDVNQHLNRHSLLRPLIQILAEVSALRLGRWHGIFPWSSHRDNVLAISPTSPSWNFNQEWMLGGLIPTNLMRILSVLWAMWPCIKSIIKLHSNIFPTYQTHHYLACETLEQNVMSIISGRFTNTFKPFFDAMTGYITQITTNKRQRSALYPLIILRHIVSCLISVINMLMDFTHLHS